MGLFRLWDWEIFFNLVAFAAGPVMYHTEEGAESCIVYLKEEGTATTTRSRVQYAHRPFINTDSKGKRWVNQAKHGRLITCFQKPADSIK